MFGSRRRVTAAAVVLAAAVVAPSGATPAGAGVVQAPQPTVTAVELANPDVAGEPSWWPVKINERGQVLGTTEATHQPLSAGTPVLWDGGAPRRIVPNGGKGFAVDLSDRGQAVGTLFEGSWAGGGAFSWLDGTYTQVSTVGEAVAVNERGDVLHQPHTLYTGPYPTPSPPLVWRDGRTVQPAPIGWGFSYLRGRELNDRGQVAFDVCLGCASGTLLRIPAIWQVGGGLTAAGRWGGGAVDVNEAGDVASTLVDSASSSTRAMLWHDGVTTDLGSLDGGLRSEAQQVNDRGHVLGQSQRVDGAIRGFLWRDGRMVDLGALDGGRSVSPMALNNRDQVVGCSQRTSGPSHAFLWQNGQVIDLHPSIPGADGTSSSCAVDLNERGEIVGFVQQADGVRRAVKWTVRGVPRPAPYDRTAEIPTRPVSGVSGGVDRRSLRERCRPGGGQ